MPFVRKFATLTQPPPDFQLKSQLPSKKPVKVRKAGCCAKDGNKWLPPGNNYSINIRIYKLSRNSSISNDLAGSNKRHVPCQMQYETMLKPEKHPSDVAHLYIPIPARKFNAPTLLCSEVIGNANRLHEHAQDCLKLDNCLF